MASFWSRGFSYARRKCMSGVVLSARAFSGSQFCRDAFFHASSAFTPGMLTRAGQQPRFLVRTSDRIVGREVFLTGDFDRAETEKTFAVLRTLGVKDFSGKTFIDIGANIGTASINALSRFGFERAVSFEPDPDNFRTFSANVTLNGLGNRVTIHHSAISDTEGILNFETGAENSGDGRVRSQQPSGVPDAMHESRRSVIQVKATTLDLVCASGAIDLKAAGLVWVDTQGHEGQVLQGGANSLLHANVPILVEYWPYALRRAGGMELFERLVSQHFREIVDIRQSQEGKPGAIPASEVKSLQARYTSPFELSDLLLLK